MSKSLVIVESGTKCKTISKYLNKDGSGNYIITASLGHICELPREQLGFDLETWETTFVPSKQNIIDKIRECVKKVDKVYLASDPDTEGEAIAYHIKNYINDLLKNKECYRITFNEITASAIKKSIENAGSINMDIVNAQMTRCILDKLVGYKLSPMLWKEFECNYLSAGRVQSVAVLICINRLNEIQKAELNPHWTINGKFKCLTKIFEAKIYNDETLIKINSYEDINNLLEQLSFENEWTINIFQNKSLQNPPPPYTTTSLQTDIYQRFKYSSKKTMNIAQKLYENGLITYMRTDSTTISDDAKKKIISYIKEKYGEDQYKVRTFKCKIANAQEAHECIRITNPKKIEIDFENISQEHKKVYDMIWKRTISCQMKPSEYLDIEINVIDNKILPLKFICKKSLLVNMGYLKVSAPSTKLDDIDEWLNIDKNKANPINFIAKSNIDDPPSLYNEVGLIKALENQGIGRPSTYASIIEKIFLKDYVSKGSNPQKIIKTESIKKTIKGIEKIVEEIKIGGSNKDLLVPTELGIKITNYLNSITPFLLDLKFTAHMEEALDKISNKETTKIDTLNAFYMKLKPVIDENVMAKIKKQTIKKQTGIIKTKYGYAYYNAETNKYTNIESYLKWKNIKPEQLTDKDIKFIASLPKKIDDMYTVHIGQYGLYLKDKNNKNIKIEKNKWDNLVNL